MSSTIPAWTWIPLVVWAAFAQTIRNAAQRSLVSSLGTLSATLVRFLYGLPFALAWLLLAYQLTGTPLRLPAFTPAYGGWMLLGALMQLAATAFMLLAMGQRNFIIGVTMSKTEVLQVGLFATVMLQEMPTLASAIAMGVATVGVVLLSLPSRPAPGGGPVAWNASAAWYGLASGACFALASVGYRGASLTLASESPWIVGAWNVLLAQAVQSLLLGGWLAARQPGAIAAILRAWRISLIAGTMGALASIGWLTAYSLRPAGDVRTLGLVEVLFSYVVSRRVFRERMTRNELLGLICVCAGVLVVCAQWRN